MESSVGLGVVVVALIAIILALVGVLSLYAAIAALLLMLGAWCVVAGILIRRKEVYSFVVLGLVLISLSMAYFIPLQYSVALALICIIAIILASRVGRRQSK